MKMTIESDFIGHQVIFKNNKWYYKDTDEELSQAKNRTCPECGKFPNTKGHDHCIQNLPGVKYACCGHGTREKSYIVFENGLIIRGFIVDKLS